MSVPEVPIPETSSSTWFEITMVVFGAVILIALVFLAYITYRQAIGAQKGVKKIGTNVGKIKEVAIAAVPAITASLTTAAQTYNQSKQQKQKKSKKSNKKK